MGDIIKSHIWIKNLRTNEVRCHNDTFEFFEYIWSEGNYSCDCNRHLFFNRVIDPDFDEDFNCGDEVYSIVDVHLPDGTKNDDMIKFMEFEKLRNNK